MAVSFHTYTSNGGPAVDVYVHGTRIGHFPMVKGDMVNSQLQDVLLQLNPNSTLNISYRGQVVVTNLSTNVATVTANPAGTARSACQFHDVTLLPVLDETRF